MTETITPPSTKQNYWSQIIFILASNAALLYGILFLKRNFFFVMYIFWFESLIRILFNALRIWKAGKDVTEIPKEKMTINKREFTIADINNRSYYARIYCSTNLFLLFTYLVFIIVMVGFVFPFSLDDNEMLIQNINIMFFRDGAFLIALLMFFASSLYNYLFGYIRNDAYKNTTVLMIGSLFEKQNLVMHISLILGIGFWIISQRYFPSYKNYSMMVLASVFVAIKLSVDIYSHHSSFVKYSAAEQA